MGTKTESQENAQKKMVRSETPVVMRSLLASVAHEIRNPLNSISLIVQLMRQTTTEPDQLGQQEKIIKEVERIDSIIRKLQDDSQQAC